MHKKNITKKIDDFNWYSIDFAAREIKWSRGNWREGGAGKVSFDNFLRGKYGYLSGFGKEHMEFIAHTLSDGVYILTYGSSVKEFTPAEIDEIKELITKSILNGDFPIKLYKIFEQNKIEIEIKLGVEIKF